MKGQVSWFERMAFLAAHPKGSYWWTDDAANPGAKYGGTWELLEAGRFLTAACAPDAEDQTYAVGSEGGSAAAQIQTQHLPSHTHSAGSDSAGNSYVFIKGVSGNVSRRRLTVGTTSDPIGVTVDELANLAVGETATASTGSGEALDIVPPYLAAYCWHRIA